MHTELSYSFATWKKRRRRPPYFKKSKNRIGTFLAGDFPQGHWGFAQHFPSKKVCLHFYTSAVCFDLLLDYLHYPLPSL